MLAFSAMDSDGVQSIWVLNIDSSKPKQLAGTESDYIPPFFIIDLLIFKLCLFSYFKIDTP